MPDLTKCVRYDGKIYCWDIQSEKIVEVKITDVSFNDVPKEVLVALLNRASGEK